MPQTILDSFSSQIFLEYILPGFFMKIMKMRNKQSELFKYILMFSISTQLKMSAKIN